MSLRNPNPERPFPTPIATAAARVHLALLAVLAMLCLPCGARLTAAGAPAAAAPTGYALVWSDEFDADGPPNPANWGFERGFERNNELQWYQPDNAVCRGGLLVIEARRERRPNPLHREGATDWRRRRTMIDYTAASLLTKGKHSWLYGRFEMRARIPTAAGIWPAFWTLGVSGEWPGCGEIDIMEFYRGGLLANAAWGSDKRRVARWSTTTKPIRDFDAGWAEQFHVWRMDWDAAEIRLYVDDLLLNAIALSGTDNGSTQWGPPNPLRQPHFLLVNLAVGGDNGGDPSGTSFPQRYEIDYVRVYQRARTAVSH